MMQALSLQQLATLLDARLQGDSSQRINHLTFDSRQVQPGSLFVALPGARTDGHRFIPAVRRGKASAALVEHWQADPLPQLKVVSPRRAMGQLAAWNRQLFSGPVVGVTGNSGKTTVKEMLAAVLRAHFGQVLATAGNLNNDLGMPLTLLKLQPVHRAAVLELGANHVGEIDYLAAIARPDIGIITNVTGAHLGEFGSMEAIASAKGELLAHLEPSGCAVLNAEDHFFDFWQRQVCGEFLSFGLQQGDVRAETISLDRFGNPSFEAITPWGRQLVSLQLPGRHNVMNALAVMAAAGRLGVPLATQAVALNALQPVSGRLHRINTWGGALLLDDSYNASPGAVRSAIDVLAELPGKRLLALGALAELGEATERIHRELGDYARQRGLDGFYTLSGTAALAAEAYGPDAVIADDHAALAELLKPVLDADTCLLVKGSRSSAMDKLVALLGRASGT
ncbi:UDP-N-acetylmuramoyl-tripeptide--D-alanyl-D-alanine ligase [Marinospirillum alkaliphilum]|uniref:UDP-N-acetylmuramoyl-tripeptide--D-alanyl-D-alanine ligase n=1 Tax=Marinospirillum alkaliphilum DSM 21637 TaxID=1122209 RepID=A0A1K1TSL3_9GAMM|nr:UDP-N-acetylmuramoyl-tripeptide--D-alanyl-D-alanine ligase [Marinospirillum alkaliphilum]SFX03051.1 UDP-N-acetylmuramoyl-tripeptide--D-alanyl-D-alanine ligase [Marinospirillum alkaliphilum DSM 21637]